MGNLTGPISLASSLVDASGFYKNLRKKPEAAKKVMERVTEGLLCLGKAQIAAGILSPSLTRAVQEKSWALVCLNNMLCLH